MSGIFKGSMKYLGISIFCSGIIAATSSLAVDITTIGEFTNSSTYQADSTATLQNDIDFPNSSGGNWLPGINNNNVTIDGGGYTVDGMNFERGRFALNGRTGFNLQNITLTNFKTTGLGLFDAYRSDANLTDVIIENVSSQDKNSTSYSGVLALREGSSATITNTIIRNVAIETTSSNDATPGGLMIQGDTGWYGPSSVDVISNTTFENISVTHENRDGYAAGILNEGVIEEIVGSDFLNNTLNVSGAYNGYGAAISVGTPNGRNNNPELGTIDDTTFSGNKVVVDTGKAYGGAIYVKENGSIDEIKNSEFTNNTVSSNSASSAFGGAIYNAGSVGTIDNTKFTGNGKDGATTTTTSGGAIYNKGTISTISNSTFSNNAASDKGAAIYNEGTITEISNSSFTGNTAGSAGGAIYTTSDLTLRNGTNFSNNSTNSYINDVYLANGANLIIDYDSTKDTVSNSVSIGSGIAADNANSSIIVQNGAQLDLSGLNWKFSGSTNVQDGTLNFVKIDSSSFVNGNVNLGDNGVLNYSTANTDRGSGRLEHIKNLSGSGTLNKNDVGHLNIDATKVGTEKFTGTINLNQGRLDVQASAQDQTGYDNKVFDFAVNVGADSELYYVVNNDGSLPSNRFILDENSKINFTDDADGASIKFTRGHYYLEDDLNNGEDNTVAFYNSTVFVSTEQLNGNYVLDYATKNVIEDAIFNGTVELINGVKVNFENGADVTYNDLVLGNNNTSLNGTVDNVVSINSVSGNGTLTNQGTSVLLAQDVSSFEGGYTQNSGSTTVTGNIFGGATTINNGQLNWLTSSDRADSSVITMNAGTFNIGDSVNAAVFNLKSTDSVADDVNLNLADNSTLKLGTNAELKINSSDNWLGTVENSGRLTVDEMSIAQSAALEQAEGEFILDNNSMMILNNNDIISGGYVALANGSTLYIDNSFTSGMSVDGLEMLNGSTLNMMNGNIDSLQAQNLSVSNSNSVVIDIAARANKSDSITVMNDALAPGASDGSIYLKDFNLIDGTPLDKNINLQVFDVNGNVENVKFLASDKEIDTPIGKYKLFANGGGSYTLGLTSFNKQVFRGQAATLAAYNNQLLVNDMLLNHFILQNERDINRSAMANKYAAANTLFAPYQYGIDNGGLWAKSYAAFETLSMTQGLNVGNSAYGTLIGADLPAIALKRGWKFVPTGYVGYNGAKQHFNGVSMHQNGGQGGLMGTFIKDDFIGSVTAYAGGYSNEMNVAGEHDDTTNWFAGTAAKVAYNLRATEHFTIQPTAMVAYNAFGKQNWFSEFGSMGMNSGMLNGINVAPGLNLIYSRDTWSVYGAIQYMYNINEQVSGRAGNVDLPSVAMRHGYIQYGIGATKTFKDRLSSYAQVNLRNGGRTGVGFQLGIKYFFDWSDVFNALLGRNN